MCLLVIPASLVQSNSVKDDQVGDLELVAAQKVGGKSNLDELVRHSCDLVSNF